MNLAGFSRPDPWVVPRRPVSVPTVPFAYRCPTHGTVATGKFAERLALDKRPTCPELIRRPVEDGATREGRCGMILTRVEVAPPSATR